MPSPDNAFDYHGTQLRLLIDGNWSVDDMSRELAALDYVYNIGAIVFPLPPVIAPGHIYARAEPSLTAPSSPYRHAVIRYFARGEWSPVLQMSVRQRCYLERLRYGSPGFQDLAGFARALEVVFEFVKFLLETKQRRERHAAEMLTTKLQQQKLAVEVAEARLNFMRKARFSARQVREANEFWATQEGLLSSLVDRDMIRGIDPKPME